jgi:DMSO/TMAO reductase YedYZ molybdopterin-dependent catalytic subunit
MGLSRRQLLRTSVVFLGGLIAACRPSDRVAPTVYVRGSTLPPPTVTPTPPPLPTTVPESLPFTVPVTPLDKLYVNSYRNTPTEAALADWRLEIGGLVERPLMLTMDDIRAMPPLEDMRTLACISNPVGGGLVGNIVWTGVDFAPILARVGVQASAKYANFDAADGYTTSVESSWLTQPGVRLAYLANGQPLPPEHGYPLRLLMPGLYGQKMPKWITRITFAERERLGYWEQDHRGWSNVAAVRTFSQLRQPPRDVPFAVAIRLAGFAFAGREAITNVEIAIRAGEDEARVWQPVTRIAPPSALAWTWWAHDWSPPAPGLYRIAVRAGDDTGFLQARAASSTFAGAFPDGTDAIHEVNLLLT